MKLAKKRYLLVKIDGQKKFSKEEAEAMLCEAILDVFGEKGLSDSGIRLKEFNEERQLALVKCMLAFQEKAIAAFALKRYFAGEGIASRLQKIFGTMRKARPLFTGSRPRARRRTNG